MTRQRETQPTDLMAEARPRWSFRLKLTLLAITVALIPVTIVGFISMDVNKKALTEANKELLYSVLHHITRHVEEGLRRDRDEMSIASSALMDTSRDLDERLALLRAVVGGGRLPILGVYDGDGLLIDTIVPELDSRAPELERASKLPSALAPELMGRLADEDMAVGPVEKDDVTGRLRVLLLARARGETTSWFLVSTLDLEQIQNELETIGHDRLGRGHSLLIVDTTLRVVADSQIEKRGSTIAKTEGILANVDANALDEGILLFGESSLADQDMLGALRSMELLPWAVVAEVPREIAFYSIHKIRVILWVVVGAAGLGALLLGIFLARRISAPLVKLVAFAGHLANRRFDQRVEVGTQDELGVLGRALSSAAKELEASDKRIRTEERIRGDLGRYLPGALVDNIVENRQKMSLGGERCNVTVLFADVVGFTPLAESQSAEDVVGLLNEFFTILTEIIFRHHGTVDKFIGDSVMAFWGAPNLQEDHAELALRAAEDMMRWLEIGNDGWREKYGVEIQLAIGVNTGEAIVGNLGSSERMEYTVIGDCVNVAARLEKIARPRQILITDKTRDAAGPSFEYASLGSRKVVGRNEPLELFEVIV